MRVISEAKFSQHQVECYPEEILNKKLATLLAEEVLKHLTIEKDYSHPQGVNYIAKAFFLTEEEHNEYQKLKNKMWEL